MVVEVKFVRSGGLAGLRMVATVDASDLPADHRGLVVRLLTEDLRGSGLSGPGGADQFSYELEIHQGERTVRRQWQEPEVNDTVRPLLAALTREAKPAR